MTQTPEVVLMAQDEHKPWSQRIAEARVRGRFTGQDADCAAKWTCCAVGEQLLDAGFYNDENFSPKGLFYQADRFQHYNAPYEVEEFDMLGCRFYEYIARDDIDGAESCLEQIQELAPVVVPQLFKKEVTP